MAGAQPRTSCRSVFKQIEVLPIPFQYILSLMSFIIKNQEIFQTNLSLHNINLQSPCILYIGQMYRYSPEYSFYIFSQQIYLIIFLDFLSPSSFIPAQNVVYFLMLPFLVHKIFTFYINVMLNCKFPAPGPEG